MHSHSHVSTSQQCQGSNLTASDSIAETASGAGAPPPPPPGGAPPPPPPPPPVEEITGTAGGDSSQDDARNALFAALNQGTDITKGLKKVTDDMKTHKNPGLRQGPAPFKPTQPPKPAPKPAAKVEPKVVKKPPVCELQDKKWIVEYQEGNNNIVIDDTNMKQTVYVYQCKNSAIMVKGKVNSIILDALNTEIVTAKSSEMNILVPVGDGDYKEFPLPEQFKTTWKNDKFVTEIAES
ncbi:hypothetical protein KUTeg_000088 [Tegillarca granosa]|uniref:C-CAP/cofactor C-like domain-containing protein n=1 Tax=Tegillarca granosa TaxID=220873 RepID=A0ABQ9FXR1_TEGGR|nr:hypothetical protein KUTeg_000088 [Tegillarca granosa]